MFVTFLLTSEKGDRSYRTRTQERTLIKVRCLVKTLAPDHVHRGDGRGLETVVPSDSGGRCNEVLLRRVKGPTMTK